MKINLYLIGLLTLIITIACSKKSDDAKSPTISVPDIRPPVQESLSTSLINGGNFSASTASVNAQTVDYTKTCQTDLTLGDVCIGLSTSEEKIRCIMKQRLFCKGPVEVLNLLKAVDDRMAEIETRSTGTVPCAAATPVNSTSEVSFPGSSTMTHYLQCKDSSINVAWGNKNDIWYLRSANGAAGSVYSINQAQDVEGYMWLRSEDTTFSMSTGLIHLKANKTAGTVEMTGGGAGLGFCSFHYKSDANYIYLIANPNGVGRTCDFDGNSTLDASDWAEACVNASDLSAASSLADCSSLKTSLTAPTLGRAQTTSSTNQVWEATATAPGSITTLQTFDMGAYLNTLYTNTGTFSSTVEEFTVQ